MAKPKRGTCTVCGRQLQLKRDGTVFHHKSQARNSLGNRAYRCPGAGLESQEYLDKLAADLAELEATDPAVAEAARRLNDTIDRIVGQAPEAGEPS